MPIALTVSSESSSTTVASTASLPSLTSEHSVGIEHPSADIEHSIPIVTKTSVKLPKLVLRPFTGDLTQWFTFWDSFNAAVHTKIQLAKVDKFNYLKTLLSSAALEAIQGLSLTDANYNEAVGILQ